MSLQGSFIKVLIKNFLKLKKCIPVENLKVEIIKKIFFNLYATHYLKWAK
jgi:hypothetical protein